MWSKAKEAGPTKELNSIQPTVVMQLEGGWRADREAILSWGEECDLGDVKDCWVSQPNYSLASFLTQSK